MNKICNICNYDNFFKTLKNNFDEKNTSIAKKLYNKYNPITQRTYWGKGSLVDSFIPIIEKYGVPHFLFSLRTNGKVYIDFRYIFDRTPFDNKEKQEELLTLFNDIKDFNLGKNFNKKRPHLELVELQDEYTFQKLITFIDYIVNQINGSIA